MIDYKGINAGGTIYSDSDHKEQINSFNGTVLGRYTKGRWNFDANIGLGFDVHDLDTEFIGEEMREGRYYSHILKVGLATSYNKKMKNNVEIIPKVGLDYNNVLEDNIVYGSTSKYSSVNIGDARGKGLTGRVEVKLKENEGKFRLDAGLGYKYNFKDTFHEDRYVEGTNLKMEKLYYEKETFTVELNASYVPNEKVTFDLGYNFEKNKNFVNQMIKAGFTINLN